ncbi:VanW family protein [Halobacillus litoralis]|uniref:VanW family protein n=1 Tax=Halobacillus litoralis TaxID=45668 RepID=UPI001CD26D15|nr:VanW family protein [Halobacillus litoralis]MCA0969923.1 VanW family protein [Halobacillus litoralis]
MEHAKGLGLLIGMTAFLLLFTYLGPMGWQIVSSEEKVYGANTSVADVSLEGMTESEAKQALLDRVSEWKNEQEVLLQSGDETIKISTNYLEFQVDETLDHILEGTNQDFVVSTDDSYKSDIEDRWNTDLKEQFNWEAWTDQLTAEAAELIEEPLQYAVYDYLQSDVTSLYETIASYDIQVDATPALSDLVSSLSAMPVEAQEAFSLIERADEQPVAIDAESLSLVATVLFGAVLETNFTVQQRHISQRLPGYAELGKEASVKPDQNDDFVFYNPNGSHYMISLSMDGSTLSAEIRGYPLVDQYVASVEDVQEVEPRTIVQYTSFVDPGAVELKQEGKQGQRAVVYRESRGEDGFTELIAEDYYPPLNRVEWRYGVEGEENSDPAGTGDTGGTAGAGGSTGETGDPGSGGTDDEDSSDNGGDDEDEEAEEVDPSNPIWEGDDTDNEK